MVMASMTEKHFMIIADDVGIHPAVDEGVYEAAAANALSAADIMVHEDWADEAVSHLRSEYPWIDIGLHIAVFPDMKQCDSGPLVYEYRSMPEQRSMLVAELLTQAKEQLHIFQDRYGTNPSHISSHNHAHQTLDWEVVPEFLDLLHDEFGSLGASVIRGFHTNLVRHSRFSLLQQGTPPLDPVRFHHHITTEHDNCRDMEIGIHPGIDKNVGPAFESPFTLAYRQQDLQGWLAIFQSDCIEEAGFCSIRPTEYLQKIAAAAALEAA
jgi:hypothetical protein